MGQEHLNAKERGMEGICEAIGSYSRVSSKGMAL